MKNIKVKLIPITLMILLLALSACSKVSTDTQPTKSQDNNQITVKINSDEIGYDYQLSPPVEGDVVAIMKTTEGDIHIKLFPSQTPIAAENFITHAINGYYNDVTFHRVMNDFMIQSGDPKGDGTGGESIWGAPFKDEYHPKLYHYRGALSMANSGTMSKVGSYTNGSQFFIVQKNSLDDNQKQGLEYFHYPEPVIKNYAELGGTMHLDNSHTVFGQVYEGMDIVDKIAGAETDEAYKPKTDIKIKSIEIIESYKP